MDNKRFRRADELFAAHCGEVPSTLQNVQFNGVKDTKRDALLKEVSGLYRSETLDELIRNSHLAARHMQDVGLFDKCVPVIDTAATSDPRSYTVKFYVEEPTQLKRGMTIQTTMAGDAEFSLQGIQKSAFGAGELASLSYTKTLRGGHSFDFTALKPFLGWQKYSNICASLSRRVDTLRWNKADVVQNNCVLEHSHRFLDNRLHHAIRLYLSWRCFEPKSDAPFPVREHAGHTSKISLENTLTYDTRDRRLLPTRGLLARVTSEYAGLLGDAAFVKNRFEFQGATLLPFGVIFGASAMLSRVDGLVGRNIHLLDRVYLGGPFDIRGFETNSIGTRAETSSLGGAFGFASAFHLYKSLVPVDMLFAHAFLSGGGVSSVRSRSQLGDIIQNPRITAGLGLTFVLNNMFRLELNYVHPLRIVAGDACTPGLHFGVGMHFL